MAKKILSSSIDQYAMGSEYPEEWDIEGLGVYLNDVFGTGNDIFQSFDSKTINRVSFEEDLKDIIVEKYEAKEKEFEEDEIREIERMVLLQIVDTKWMDHIDAMDQLKQGIGLRAMGQKDPVMAYQVEGFDMFEAMNYSIAEDTIKLLYHISKQAKMERKRVANPIDTPEKGGSQTVVKSEPEIGRNDPCPCGSGKKYKHCCGRK